MSNNITKEDIRFVESWKEQREGSKIKYYLLYTVAWGLLIIFLSFFTIIFSGGISIIPIAQDNYKIVLIVAIGFIIGMLIAILGRSLNEKRYQRILRKVREHLN